jgi:hypothetical protein
VIKSANIMLKEVVRAIIWSRNCKKKIKFCDRFRVTKVFCFGFAFIVVNADFYYIEIIRFKIICQLNSLFTIKQRNSVLRSISNRHFRVFLFEYF